MGLIDKFKNFLATTLGSVVAKSNYVYMQNIIHGQLQNTIDYIKKAYQVNADVYSIVSWIAGKAATVPFTLSEVVDNNALIKYKAMCLTDPTNFKELKKLQAKALKLVEGNHRILTMLNVAPNDYMPASEYKFGWFLYRLLTGNTFIRGWGPEAMPDKFVELHLLPAHLCTPLGGGMYMKPRAYKLNWDPEEIPGEFVSHSRYFNPNFEWPSNPHIIGQAPLMAAAGLVHQSNSGNTYMSAAFENGGMAGVLYSDGLELSDPQRDALQQHIDSKSGKHNAKQILAANSKMGWLKIGESPVDLGVIQAINTTLRGLCNVFHMNSAIFNDPENKTYNNMTEARKAGITDAVIPELIAFRDQMNLWLVPGWEKADKKKYFVDYDASVFPEMQANMKELAEWLNTAWWLSPNQKLEQMDYEPQGPEFDVPFIPSTVAPLGAVTDPNNIDFQKAFDAIGNIDYKG